VDYRRIIGDSARRRTSDVTRKKKLINLDGSRGPKKNLRLSKIVIYDTLFDFVLIKKNNSYSFHGPLRIVVKNLQPTTTVEDIAAAIEEIGHSV